jgi:transglutaminase-like putative cysteine protease
MLSLLRPIPRPVARVLTMLVLVLWALQMGILVRKSYVEAGTLNLATDLSRYGTSAVWRGIYYRGTKIGFSVSQTVALDEGYEIQEDGRLQMALLGATTIARTTTRVRLDDGFSLKSFSFALDPGTGPLQVEGVLDGLRLNLTIKSKSGTRTQVVELQQPPMLAQNLSRRLAKAGLQTGKVVEVLVFDPATLANRPMRLTIGKRELIRVTDLPVPAFRVDMTFAGLRTTSWITDTGDVVREESPTGMLVLKERQERATTMAVGDAQLDMLDEVSIVPVGRFRIDDPASVERLRVRLTGFEFGGPDLEGAGQSTRGEVIDIVDTAKLPPTALDPTAAQYLQPEAFIESDAPEIVAEARKAVGDAALPRLQAERLVRYVNALLEKRPTVSLPSATEVLRTRVGDCNEHTVLYVAMARALSIPARIAVGVVNLHGAFFYHAWPEVYVAQDGGGQWLPVDPTLNQFPADPTHIRLARGGLEKQAAIMPAIGQARMEILELQVKEGSTPVLVGATNAQDTQPIDIPMPARDGGGGSCWSSPPRRR